MTHLVALYSIMFIFNLGSAPISKKLSSITFLLAVFRLYSLYRKSPHDLLSRVSCLSGGRIYHPRRWSVPNLFNSSAFLRSPYVATNGPPELRGRRSAKLSCVLHPWLNDTRMEPNQKLFIEKSSLVCSFLPLWVSDHQQEDQVNTNYIWLRLNALVSHGKIIYLVFFFRHKSFIYT